MLRFFSKSFVSSSSIFKLYHIYLPSQWLRIKKKLVDYTWNEPNDNQSNINDKVIAVLFYTCQETQKMFHYYQNLFLKARNLCLRKHSKCI